MKLQEYVKRFALVPAILSEATLGSISGASISNPGAETITAPQDGRAYVARHFGNIPDGLEDPGQPEDSHQSKARKPEN